MERNTKFLNGDGSKFARFFLAHPVWFQKFYQDGCVGDYEWSLYTMKLKTFFLRVNEAKNIFPPWSKVREMKAFLWIWGRSIYVWITRWDELFLENQGEPNIIRNTGSGTIYVRRWKLDNRAVIFYLHMCAEIFLLFLGQK